MVKRKRQSSASSKPTTTTTTTTTAAQPTSRRQNSRQSNQILIESNHLEVKRSRSTDSADSTSAPQVRGRSAPTSSSRENGKQPFVDMETQVEALSPISDKNSAPQQEPESPVNGRSRGGTKTSSVSSNSTTTKDPLSHRFQSRNLRLPHHPL